MYETNPTQQALTGPHGAVYGAYAVLPPSPLPPPSLNTKNYALFLDFPPFMTWQGGWMSDG